MIEGAPAGDCFEESVVSLNLILQYRFLTAASHRFVCIEELAAECQQKRMMRALRMSQPSAYAGF